jgi:PH (Pleckstrin Homology) domain-containing protein/putative oligomerization/nucleic acid binding protein
LSDEEGAPPQSRIEELADQKLSRRIRFMVRREIKGLEDKLGEGEEVINLAQGVYEKKNGLLAVTDRRVVFVEEGVFRRRLEDFPYDKISSVQTSTGMRSGKLTIFGSGNKAVIDQVYPKQRTVEIGDYVRARIAASSRQQAPSPISGSASPAGRLRQLVELRDAGVITPEDFEAQKARILSEM